MRMRVSFGPVLTDDLPRRAPPRDLGWRFVTWVLYGVLTPLVVLWSKADRTEAK